MSECVTCNHPAHEWGSCNHAITEDIRDDVGYFAPPTGITRTLIVARCKCRNGNFPALYNDQP